MSGGPLTGVRVVELGGVGPAPFGTMLLADLGAEVIRIERPPTGETTDRYPPPRRVLARGVRSVVIDLKSAAGKEIVHRLLASADALVEGFRPGVAERLGFAADAVLATNPRLVYARMTGWGQSGPRAMQAGHDINYLAASGALSLVGRAGEPPVPPVNLVGDFGGGGMLLVVGVLAAVLEARTSGQGQVVDVAMLDGSALLTTVLHEWRATGDWRDERGSNFIDTGAPFYDVYPTGDGRWLAVGAIERRFWAELVRQCGLDEAWLVERQHDREYWPAIRGRLAERLLRLTPQQVDDLAANQNACVTLVRGLGEVATDPHNAERGVLRRVGEVELPAPAPRFSRTPAPVPSAAEPLGASTAQVLSELGYDTAAVRAMVDAQHVLLTERHHQDLRPPLDKEHA